MSRGPLRFKETDVRRFLRAFTKEGLPVEVTLDLERRSLTVIPFAPSEDVGVNENNETEKWLAKHAHQRQGN